MVHGHVVNHHLLLQPVIRLYAVPASTFAGDDDDVLGDLSEEE